MTSSDLLHRLSSQPFRPFRMKLVDDRTFDVFEPRMMIVGSDSAVVATRKIRDDRGNLQTTDWRTISIDWIREFKELGGQR
jgi:hypothetical protein